MHDSPASEDHVIGGGLDPDAPGEDRTVAQDALGADPPDPGPAARDEPEQPSPPDAESGGAAPPSAPLDVPVADSYGDIEIPAAADARATEERLLNAISALRDEVREVAALRLRDAEVIARLHDEIQILRVGELSQAQAPLISDVLRVYDGIERLSEVSDEREDLGLVRSSLLEGLLRNGIELLVTKEGEAFDSALHSAMGRVETDAPERDRTVACVRQAGFTKLDGRVVRAAQVDVFRYRGDGSEQVTQGEDGGE